MYKINLNHPISDDFFDKYEKALYYEIFEKGEYDFIIDKLKTSKIVFDIGSHIGLFSLFCLENSSNDLIIHAFEASKLNFEKSREVLANYSHHVHFVNKFVSYKLGFEDFYFNSTKTMQSSTYSGNFLNKGFTSQKVETIDLFSYILSQKLDYPNSIDIAKIDIEGYEFELLQNINLHFFDCVATLVLEYHILSDEFAIKYDLLLKKLKLHYKNITIKKSQYNENVGIIFCEK